MKRQVFFVLCCIISIGSNSQNLILNSDFETWSKIEKPASWTNTQGCLKDSVFVLSGSYSCKQEATTTSRDLGQKFIVSPSTQYRLSISYKTGIETTGNGCRVWCSWLDNTQVAIAEPVVHSGFLKGDGWQKYEAAVTSPEGAGYFYLLVRTLPSSVTYWDDFLFEEDIVSSEKETIIPEIKIYPNPSHNYLTISNLHTLQHIDIQSITGHTVFSEEFHGEKEITISISGLPRGLYFIRIVSSGKQNTYKIVKN